MYLQGGQLEIWRHFAADGVDVSLENNDIPNLLQKCGKLSQTMASHKMVKGLTWSGKLLLVDGFGGLLSLSHHLDLC